MSTLNFEKRSYWKNGQPLQNGVASVEQISNLFYRMRQPVIQVIDIDSDGDCSTM